jgi:polyphosphate kinase 2 (PPK2 family)
MARKDAFQEEKSIKRKKYEKELRRLQADLCRLQDWVKYKGLRVIVVFDGRDVGGGEGSAQFSCYKSRSRAG